MRLKIVCGQRDYPLYKEISDYLHYSNQENCHVAVTSTKFSNENIKIRIEERVRGDDVFIIQPCYPNLNERIMELFVLIDALKYASARRITVVLPYFPYVRSDKKDEARISITARLMADLIQAAGANRVLTINLHSAQIQGFFRLPIDHLLPGRTIVKFLKEGRVSDDTLLVAPDTGSAKMVSYYSQKLGRTFVVVSKRRIDDTENPKIMDIIGCVEGYHCIIIDDEIASGGTVIKASEELMKLGATGVDVCAVHGVFTKESKKKFSKCPHIKKIYITNSVHRSDIEYPENLEFISLAEMVSQAILCIHKDKSMSDICDRYQI